MRSIRESVPAWRAPATSRRRNAFAASFSVLLLLALSVVGGASYAANAIAHVAGAAAHIVAPSARHGVVIVTGLSSGGDQYQPGFGFGDPNHTHAGPPGLTGKKSAHERRVGSKKKIVTRIRIDEQAALYISVLDPDGNRLLLDQNGSKVGNSEISGIPVKTIHYVVLVPRSIPIALLVPADLLVPGDTYRIHVIAVSPSEDTSAIDIPFVA